MRMMMMMMMMMEYSIAGIWLRCEDGAPH